jgi:hypothetical protein
MLISTDDYLRGTLWAHIDLAVGKRFVLPSYQGRASEPGGGKGISDQTEAVFLSMG